MTRRKSAIIDNDSFQLYAVTYLNANYVTTDPVYVGTEFNGWKLDTEITTDHWFDKDVGESAGKPAEPPHSKYDKDRAYPVS